MQKIILIVITLITFSSFAQDSWITVNPYKNKEAPNKTIKDIQSVTNEDTGDLAVFVRTNTDLTCYLYNKKQELIQTVISNKIPKNSKILIGSTVKNKEYSLFFSNGQKTRFSALHINFETGAFKSIESLNVSSKKEKRIQFLKIKNQLHLLTYVKKTSILKLYAFQINGLLSSKTYDLSNEKFGEHLYGNYPLDITLFGNNSNNNIKTITHDVPNALEKTYSYAKVYIQDSKILLTSNLFDRETTIITLNPNNSDYEYKTLKNKSYNVKDLAKKSNSYIYGNTLFYVYSTNKKIDLAIYNLENNTLNKEFNITKKAPISFKNTPIIQEGGELDKYRELEKSSQFIRKLSNSNPAVSVYKTDNQFILTLGASEERYNTTNYALAGGLIGGLIGAALLSTLNSYSTSKSTRIVCLLDEQFNPIKDSSIPKNSFDKIEAYRENFKINDLVFQTIFKYENNLIWGYLNKKNKTYNLYKFD